MKSAKIFVFMLLIVVYQAVSAEMHPIIYFQLKCFEKMKILSFNDEIHRLKEKNMYSFLAVLF